jgi:hypothetical protein
VRTGSGTPGRRPKNVVPVGVMLWGLGVFLVGGLEHEFDFPKKLG